jgi:alpha-mannosidase
MPDKRRRLFLVCNAHLDPVWLWTWEEGLAETLSTFRAAAALCREFDGFVFNHNEALLYRWVETYDTGLMASIRELVREGKWHVAGGWFLQPDCNMPCGESMVRQIVTGRRYFLKTLGEEPRIAVNFDSFGHSRGLVQILKKTGYEGYLFCRPGPDNLKLPDEDFLWEGYDGSRIPAHRAVEHYNSSRGKAGERVETWLERNPEKRSGLLLWGIGNHGGGPSREDLTRLQEIIQANTGREIRHSTPEGYFEAKEKDASVRPAYAGSLNPWAVGCYTSMAGVKQAHRRLENACFLTEKMAAQAAIAAGAPYPAERLDEALEDLLFCQFHDVLPGSSVQEVEEYALQRMSHGMEILSRLKMRAFFHLLQGQKPPREGEFLLMVYNPHPFPLNEILACEFQPPEPNPHPEAFWMPVVTDSRGTALPCQLEKESSNIANDHRKRVVFQAALPPGTMSRFICRLDTVEAGSRITLRAPDLWKFRNDSMELHINPNTGLVDAYRVHGRDFLGKGALSYRVMKDSADPWGMHVTSFREEAGRFRLLSPEECAVFAAVDAETLEPVRVVEDGAVRTVVEVLQGYGYSRLCQRIAIPREGTGLEVSVRIYWQEKDRMLKLVLPVSVKEARCFGQTVYGVEEFPPAPDERVAQQWIGFFSADFGEGLTLINDGIYGFDFDGGDARLSLLRSPAYSGHPVVREVPIVPRDRLEPRQDQGERRFRVWIKGCEGEAGRLRVDREALVKNQMPMVLSCSPDGSGSSPRAAVVLEDEAVQLSAMKMAEGGEDLVLRLFNPTGNERRLRILLPVLDIRHETVLGQYEIKTVRIERKSGEIREADLLERIL